MSEWKEYKLGEIAEIITGYPFPGEKYESSGNLRVVRGENVTIGNLRWDTEKHWNHGIEGLEKYFLQSGDVVIGMDGSRVGDNRAKVKQVDLPLILAQRVACLRAKRGFCQDYLWYAIFSDNFKNYVEAIHTGTSIPHISQKQIEDFEILCPSIDTQRRIASILTSLDDKIDLLRRENATLEAMAETLFRQWFVVEAKEEWEEGTIVDFAKHCKDSINPQKHPDTVFLHYSIPAYDDGKKPTTETGGNIQSNKYLVLSNCVLFSKLNPHKDKRVWLMLDDVPDNAICSTEFQIVKPTNPEYLYFLYGWLTNKENYDEIASGVGGTSGSHQRIDPKSIFSFTCPNVDSETIRNYNNKVEPLFYKIRNNQKQIQTLIQTRDGLLPRLMNKEISM
jgi:type I restriction enzyme S subunit